MCLLLETMAVTNGVLLNSEAHHIRMERAVRYHWGQDNRHDLRDILQGLTGKVNPDWSEHPRWKFRLLYNKEVIESSLTPYTLPSITSLKLVVDDDIRYPFKFADRSALNRLHDLRGRADDVLIVRKGLVTDISFANVAFFDGNFWFTPVEPLLKGVQRASLLSKGIIREATIEVEHLRFFKKARLINALIRWDDKVDVSMEHIGW